MKNNVKILKFQKKNDDLISDDEIMKIFNGLFRLIKKSAEYSAFKAVEKKLKTDAEKIKALNEKLSRRDKQLEQLLKLNENLTDKLKQTL